MQPLELIKAYALTGCQLIPCDGKIPSFPWKKAQTEKQNPDQAIDYFAKHPEKNVGIVTGKLSNLTVIDIDVKPDTDQAQLQSFLARYNSLWTVKTGGGGFHLYFKWAPVKNAVRVPNDFGLLLDIRSDGGFVVAPPSKTKASYEFLNTDDPVTTIILKESLPDFPEDLLVSVERATNPHSAQTWKSVVECTITGNRNVNATTMIGKVLVGFAPKDWNVIALPLLKAWNHTFVSPPLEDPEFQTIFESVAGRELNRRWEEGFKKA